VKVGWTENDPRNRLNNLQSANPVKLVLWGVIPGDRSLESEIHERLFPYLIRGEWFERQGALELLSEFISIEPKGDIQLTEDVEERSKDLKFLFEERKEDITYDDAA